jgi:polyphosphate kinase 2 (PPK2 family)
MFESAELGHAVDKEDRSWYGRVLVERVEGLCAPADWMRQITKDEQLRRFEEREAVGFKQHKITPEDWHNREKWDDYEVAVCDMVDRTSVKHAPWTLVEANDKRFARIKVLETLRKRITEAL